MAAVINRQQLLKIRVSWKLSCKSMPIKTPLPLTKPCRIPFAALFSNYGRCALGQDATCNHASRSFFKIGHSSCYSYTHRSAYGPYGFTHYTQDRPTLHSHIGLHSKSACMYTQNRPACTLKNRSVVSRRTSSSRPQVLEVGLSLRSLRSVIEVSH